MTRRLLRGAQALIAAASLWGVHVPVPAQQTAPPPAPVSAQASPPAPACPPVATMPDAATMAQWLAQAQDRGPLWRVERDGRSAWLYGTIHVAKAEWVMPGPTILGALRQADQLALELDLLAPDTMARLQTLIRQPAQAPALPDAVEQRIRHQEQRACVGAMLRGLRPEFRVSALVTLAGRWQGLDPSYGIDATLAGIAHQVGKPVVALETPESQVQVLLGADAQQTLDQVQDMLADLEDPARLQILLRLADDWQRADVDDLAAYPSWCDCLQTPAQRALEARLVGQRNVTMAAGIEALMTQGHSPFVAVGALHMSGPQGIPALLAARGYRVTRLTPTRAAAAPAGSREVARAAGRPTIDTRQP